MCTLLQWITIGFPLLIILLNVSLILVLGLSLVEDQNHGYYDTHFRIAAILLNSISVLVKFIEKIIDMIKSCTKICRCNCCEDVSTLCQGCLYGIIFILVYIGNLVMLVFNAILLSRIYSVTFTVSCALIAILCVVQTLWICCFYIWEYEEDDTSESDRLIA